MNTPNPVVYEFCRNAWEKYRREEDLPVQSLPELVPNNEEVFGGAGKLLAALRRALIPHKSGVLPRMVGHKALVR